ncbi:hypothetical protein GCM10018965_078730 [Nonomuraea roseola]
MYVRKRVSWVIPNAPALLRHAAVSLGLNADPKAAERARPGVDVLLRVYAKCIDGQRAVATSASSMPSPHDVGSRVVHGCGMRPGGFRNARPTWVKLPRSIPRIFREEVSGTGEHPPSNHGNFAGRGIRV